jgi:succinyl-diaminopimelate desuccinylase
MKGGIAVALSLAAALVELPVDVTYVLYEGEEVEQEFNGLAMLARVAPHLLDADFAILMEPSGGVIEAGCQGSLTADVAVRGRRAHAARAWMGTNAIHEAGAVIARLDAYRPRRPVIDSLVFHEGLNAVGIRGGVAMNVIPDECVIRVNHRFAPDRSAAEAEAFLRSFFEDFSVTVIESSPAAHPFLAAPPASSLVAAAGGVTKPKLGWTDVARFIGLGVPAVNLGPGDPLLAHAPDERVPIPQLHLCHELLREWLGTGVDW